MLIVCALAPGFLIAGFLTVTWYREARTGIFDRVQQAVRMAERRHQETRAGATAILRVAERRLREQPPEEACDALTEGFAVTGLLVVVGATTNGVSRIVCQSRQDERVPLVSDADRGAISLALASGDLAPGNYFLSADASGSRLGIAFPLSAQGEDAGYLVVFHPLDWFQEMSNDLGLPPGSALTIINSKGVMMARHPDPQEWVGRVIAGSPLFNLISGPAAAAVGEAEGADGLRRIYAFSRLGNDPHASYLVVGISAAPLRKAAIVGIVRTGMGLLFATLLALLVARAVAERLVLRQSRALIAGARKLADGDLSARIDLPGNADTEMEQLAQALNNLAAKVQLMQQAEAQRYSELRAQATLLEGANAEIDAQRRRLDGLSQELLRTQEKERQQIARELHDQMGQSLTAMKINLQIEKSVRGDSTHLAESFRIVDGLIAEVRDLALSLRPALLDEQGLRGALSYLLESESKRSGLQTRSEISIGDTRFTAEIELVVFRIAQESLTNAVRYAAACALTLTLARVGNHLVLTVTDDGTGFDVDAAADSGGFGLLGMRERAELANGQFRIDSGPGAGTSVHLTIPLPA